MDDASLVTGMLAPARLSQLTQFAGLAAPPSKQVDEPSLTFSSLHGLSLDDKVATLSALQPSAAAAILGMLRHLLQHGHQPTASLACCLPAIWPSTQWFVYITDCWRPPSQQLCLMPSLQQHQLNMTPAT